RLGIRTVADVFEQRRRARQDRLQVQRVWRVNLTALQYDAVIGDERSAEVRPSEIAGEHRGWHRPMLAKFWLSGWFCPVVEPTTVLAAPLPAYRRRIVCEEALDAHWTDGRGAERADVGAVEPHPRAGRAAGLP